MNIHQRITTDGIRKIVDFNGIRFVVSDDKIQARDLYLAERNTGPQLLTCQFVNEEDGWIAPMEAAYLYDTCECIKVIGMEDI